MPRGTYDQNVFVNCRFDPSYASIFDAIIFAIHDCGFVARCALEENDSAQIRVEKIYGIISECRFGIHDVSRKSTVIMYAKTSGDIVLREPIDVSQQAGTWLGAFTGMSLGGPSPESDAALGDAVAQRVLKLMD